MVPRRTRHGGIKAVLGISLSAQANHGICKAPECGAAAVHLTERAIGSKDATDLDLIATRLTWRQLWQNVWATQQHAQEERALHAGTALAGG
jgi:hypothetical protein